MSVNETQMVYLENLKPIPDENIESISKIFGEKAQQKFPNDNIVVALIRQGTGTILKSSEDGNLENLGMYTLTVSADGFELEKITIVPNGTPNALHM